MYDEKDSDFAILPIICILKREGWNSCFMSRCKKELNKAHKSQANIQTIIILNMKIISISKHFFIGNLHFYSIYWLFIQKPTN